MCFVFELPLYLLYCLHIQAITSESHAVTSTDHCWQWSDYCPVYVGLDWGHVDHDVFLLKLHKMFGIDGFVLMWLIVLVWHTHLCWSHIWYTLISANHTSGKVQFHKDPSMDHYCLFFIHCVPKKYTPWCLTITLANMNRFSNSFTSWFLVKFSTYTQ